MLKCTLTTPMSSLGWLQFRRQQICSLSPTRDKSGHVRSLATVQNQTQISAQSKLRSSYCLAKNKAERIILLLCTLVERLLASKSTSESSQASSSSSPGHIFESFLLRTVFEQGGIEIAQLVADWLIRLPIRTCVKPPVTSDCSLVPNLLFVDWLKILANEKQAVQFRSHIVLVCE